MLNWSSNRISSSYLLLILTVEDHAFDCLNPEYGTWEVQYQTLLVWL